MQLFIWSDVSLFDVDLLVHNISVYIMHRDNISNSQKVLDILNFYNM